NAFESGVPLAKMLASLKSGGAGDRTINIVAHSLGNMVVNSAISRPEVTASTIKNYIMYDAALPAEVFGPGFTPQLNLLKHAIFLGYPGLFSADSRWKSEWQDMVAGNPHRFDPIMGTDLGPDYTDLNNWCAKLNA